VGVRHGVLELEARKWHCVSCGRYFRQRFPGVLPCQRASEAFQAMIFRQHLDGINRSRLGRREGIGAATVTRNNGITEGFHNKMELINRQAYGFRNFENYRLRVKAFCG
jgi:hypothetical protein